MSEPLARLRHHSEWRTLEEAWGFVAVGLACLNEAVLLLLLIKRRRPAPIRR